MRCLISCDAVACPHSHREIGIDFCFRHGKIRHDHHHHHHVDCCRGSVNHGGREAWAGGQLREGVGAGARSGTVGDPAETDTV